ncbi:MAG: hypothetical protein PHV79_02430 [Clostridia bacterium]|jgi:hypothetical protein|nr:hypothetical protein [Clostridia bacterium]MDD4408642.1 hypothetical protein [Clostridia bacterium]
MIIILVKAPLTPKTVKSKTQLKPAKYVLYAIKINPTGTKYTVNEQTNNANKNNVYDASLVKKYENEASSLLV